MPPAIPLLTMIRLIEELVTEIQKRRCPPAENFIFGIRIQMWPAFQKAMHEHIESMKKLAEGGASYGYFSRPVSVTDATVAKVRYLSFSGIGVPHGSTRLRGIISISLILSCT
jgi:hypothetical protein